MEAEKIIINEDENDTHPDVEIWCPSRGFKRAVDLVRLHSPHVGQIQVKFDPQFWVLIWKRLEEKYYEGRQKVRKNY